MSNLATAFFLDPLLSGLQKVAKFLMIPSPLSLMTLNSEFTLQAICSKRPASSQQKRDITLSTLLLLSLLLEEFSLLHVFLEVSMTMKPHFAVVETGMIKEEIELGDLGFNGLHDVGINISTPPDKTSDLFKLFSHESVRSKDLINKY